ncbi:MAG: hypothetical protein HRT37_02065 [Alteromonadaceae bacterium]|nr:hypothetical protein [Alteromonadaceae bacterium]
MTEVSMLSVIGLGIAIGLFHAFDVDHVVAMATFVDKKSKLKPILYYAIKWGTGHGGVLLLLGVLLAFIGIQLPDWFVHYSEITVGLLLIYLGCRVLGYLTKNGHTSSQSKNQSVITKLKHDHAPILIGMLHGVAGSASVLMILPNMMKAQFLIHIALFSMGCLLGMFCFGLCLGFMQSFVTKHNQNMADIFTRCLGFSSIGLGSVWIIS